MVLYDELDAISKTDDFVREKLRRNEVVEKIKQKNYEALAKSQQKLDRSRSPEMQRSRGFGY